MRRCTHPRMMLQARTITHVCRELRALHIEVLRCVGTGTHSAMPLRSTRACEDRVWDLAYPLKVVIGS